MRWIFLAPFVVLSSFCFGQVPDYVPQDGLVAWYPFNGNTDDESGNNNHCTLHGIEAYEEDGQAIYFDGETYLTLSNVIGYELEGFSVFANVKLQGNQYGDIIGEWPAVGETFLLRYVPSEGWAVNLIASGQVIYQSSGIVSDWSEWAQVGFVYGEDGMLLYVNGESVAMDNFEGAINQSSSIITIGAQENYNFGGRFHGWMDDVKIWTRSLTSEEVQTLHGLTGGCIHSAACNYAPDAEWDDGSCEYVSCHCLEGTVWDSELGGCIPSESCQDDLDGDGVVGVNDLMQLLSSFGTDCPLVEPAEWTCGDPVSYHGYDYETVLIGEQCWFAENSRYIPAVSPASDYSMSEPRCHVYGYNGTSVEDAMFTEEYNVYGALYNFQAILQWEICPTGWHVPTDGDWMQLELALGIPADSLDAIGYRGSNIGDQLKSESLWNGTNQSGMNMLPGGGTVDSGEFVFLEERGWFWSSTEAPQQAAWFRELESNQNGIYRAHWNQNQEGGESVRCIQD